MMKLMVSQAKKQKVKDLGDDEPANSHDSLDDLDLDFDSLDLDLTEEFSDDFEDGC